MSFALIYITYPSEKVAQDITSTILEKKLAAGCNIFPIESSYWWKGAIAREGEFVSILQTSLTTWPHLRDLVSELHPYEVPCIIMMEVTANEAYVKWVEESTQQRD